MLAIKEVESIIGDNQLNDFEESFSEEALSTTNETQEN